jgi:hypothetical protein
MAATSNITLRGFFSSLAEGSRSISPDDLVNTDAPAAVDQIQLVSGDNEFTSPINAKGAVILFDSRSTTAKTLKGAAEDTGVLLHPSNWVVLTFDPNEGGTDFILNSDDDDTVTADEVTTDLLTEIIYF